MHIISRGLVTTARLLTVCWLLGVFGCTAGLPIRTKRFFSTSIPVVAASAVAMYVFLPQLFRSKHDSVLLP